MPVAGLLILAIILSATSGLYAGASFFPQQAPYVTITTTIYTTTTSWTTSIIWSTVTTVVYGVWTTVQYTTSTSTVTVTPRTAKTVAANGNARISTAQFKFGGASGLFDGNGAYLSTPDSADWAFGSGDFTIDFWVRFNSLPAVRSAIYCQFVDWDHEIVLALENIGGTYYWAFLDWEAAYVVYLRATTTPSRNTWYHVAVVRQGVANWFIFLDGVSLGASVVAGSASASVTDLTASLSVGAEPAIRYFDGWLDDFRVSKGVARWTSNFTPPTSAYTNDANTVLLLHMDGADGSTTFIDDVTSG